MDRPFGIVRRSASIGAGAGRAVSKRLATDCYLSTPRGCRHSPAGSRRQTSLQELFKAKVKTSCVGVFRATAGLSGNCQSGDLGSAKPTSGTCRCRLSATSSWFAPYRPSRRISAPPRTVSCYQVLAALKAVLSQISAKLETALGGSGGVENGCMFPSGSLMIEWSTNRHPGQPPRSDKAS